MGIGIKLKYFGIIFKSKLNKMLQKRYVYIPDTQQSVLIKSFSELYAAEYVNEVAISINTNLAKEREVLKLIVKRLISQNKKVILIEEVRAFDDNDLKEFAALGRDIHIDQRYMEPSKAIAQNQVLYTDMTSYVLIMEKLDFFEEICNKYCQTDYEKVVFTIVSLMDYMKYVNTLNSKIMNSCLVNSLILRNGVCLDYSIALWKCLDRLNIECNVVKGFAFGNQEDNSAAMFNHAWNQVKIDGKWFNVDLTWTKTMGTTKFLLVNDEEFCIKNSHKTRFKRDVCRVKLSRDEVKRTVIKYRSYKNIFKEFDKGNKETTLKFR